MKFATVNDNDKVTDVTVVGASVALAFLMGQGRPQ